MDVQEQVVEQERIFSDIDNSDNNMSDLDTNSPTPEQVEQVVTQVRNC